jgi:hypothetical protein
MPALSIFETIARAPHFTRLPTPWPRGPLRQRTATLYPMLGILGVTILLPRVGLAGIRLAIRRLLDPPSRAAMSDAKGPLARKADICAKIFDEAKRLVRIGEFGEPLDHLVFRACELLDDVDEVLVALHPVRNASEFATAAALHRELEQIQAAIPVPSRGQGPRRRLAVNDR